MQPNSDASGRGDLSIGELDLHLFAEGKHRHCMNFLGAHVVQGNGVNGTRFAVWAPNARAVHVTGSFNDWNRHQYPLHRLGDSGIWTGFVADAKAGDVYKYSVASANSPDSVLKSDPCGREFELRPSNASVIPHESLFSWTDKRWMTERAARDWMSAPMSIYEVHLGSWQRDEHGGFLNYKELAHRLCAHVRELGFTHIELLPITEHPYDASWGYQCLGYFAPTSRFGSPDDLRYFVNYCHKQGIGVLLDWVPAHFPTDEHGLGRFDGTALYEHADPRQGVHRDWNTYIFNYGRNEVRSFLISSALYWLQEFHFDGLRVDAVASMLYLNYSRDEGDWIPNQDGGNTNLDAISLLKELNHIVHTDSAGAVTIAEESTSWPQVSKPPHQGGLGFSMKWNLGWMHDTLDYMSLDPIYRQYHHEKLTFSMMYAHTENFVLPFSHDEVVHGKRSLLGRMPGDQWQQFATLRLALTWQFLFPGKKLLFMGAELADSSEWYEGRGLPWHLSNDPYRRGLARLISDLNKLYVESPALHTSDFDTDSGFGWLDCHDHNRSVISFYRQAPTGETLLAIVNCTPVVRNDYRAGAPERATYQEILNTDATPYGGSNIGKLGTLQAFPNAWMGMPNSITMRLPPLGAVVLRSEPGVT